MRRSHCHILVVLGCAAVCGWGVPAGSGEPSADSFQAPFEKMLGPELVRQLESNKTRSRAFYELHRRSFKDDASAQSLGYSDDGYELFLRSCYGANVMIVPQAGGALPLYLVTYGGFDRFWPRRYPDDGKYRVPRRDELFPPIADPPQRQADDPNRNFHVFSGEGKMLRLFAEETFTQESFADVTGDGRLAYVEVADDGLEGADSLHIRTLQVATVEEKPRVVLRLLLNWNRDDWTHRVRDTDGDGVCEIEIGPRTKAGITPMVLFRWDKKTQTFVSSKLGKSDHFRLLPDDWEAANSAFKKFRKAKLSFSATPGAVSEDYAFEHRTEKTRLGTEKKFPHGLPGDFWKLEPKAAALAFADLNRSEEHRNRFRLAVEDRDGAEPPRMGSVAMTEHTQGCFGPREAAWFLRIDPQISYLVCDDDPGSRAMPGLVELKRLPYERAQQIGAVLWWLDRIRTHPEDLEPPMGFSTTSRDWSLAIRDTDGILALGRAEMSSFPGWKGTFTRKVYLEYATWLLRHAFLAPGDPAKAEAEQASPQARTPDAHSSFETARQLLTWWTPDEKQISHHLATAAAHIVAGTKDAEILDLLRKIAAQLPPEAEAATAAAALSTELKTTYDESHAAHAAFFQTRAASEFPALDEKYTAVQEKYSDLRFRYGASEAVSDLRKAVATALAMSAQNTGDAKGRSQ